MTDPWQRFETALTAPLVRKLMQLMENVKGTCMEARTVDFGGIGWAVNHLRVGHKVRRTSWPSGVWIAYLPDEAMQVPAKLIEATPGEGAKVRAMLLLRNVAGHFTPFTASQLDLLAGDWEMVDAPQPGHTSITAEKVAAIAAQYQSQPQPLLPGEPPKAA